MKKLFFTTLVLTALLSATVGTAFAGSALELVGVSHNSGGVSFTFRVNGEFSVDELVSGFVQVQGGDDFPLYCEQTAVDEVVCHASSKIAGQNVVVGFGGARFWEFVPEFVPRGSSNSGYVCPSGWICYPMYFVNDTFPNGTGFILGAEFLAHWQPVDGQVIDSGSDPNGWGSLFIFSDGSNPNPGSGFPSLGAGWYQ